MNPQIDVYLREGCGRCPLGGTPNCKVHLWTAELVQLRRISLACGLTEELKWSQPCYTYDGANVLIVSALKECSVLGFFKGALLRDEAGLLSKPGENSQAVRQFRFTGVAEILDLEALIKAYIFEAIEIEKKGLKVKLKETPEPIPDELAAKFAEVPALQTAFEALTAGRQRGYILYFSKPKQSKTRTSRIEKYMDKIFEGKGFHDR